MESSIAEFLKRQIACELLPTSIMYVFDLLWKLWHSNINLIMFCFRCLSFCWTLKGPQKFRKSHWCVPFTATFSKRRKIGASWSERCDNLSCSQVIQNSQDFSDPGVEKQAAPGSQRVRNSYHLLVVFFSASAASYIIDHTFSAFWLWSSVVSVLISVTTDMFPTGNLLVTLIFSGEVSSWACSRGLQVLPWHGTKLGVAHPLG